MRRFRWTQNRSAQSSTAHRFSPICKGYFFRHSANAFLHSSLIFNSPFEKRKCIFVQYLAIFVTAMPQAAFFCKQIDPVLWRGFCSPNRDRRKSVSIINTRALDAPMMSGNGKIIFVLRLRQNDMSDYWPRRTDPKRAVVCSAEEI